MRTRRAAARPNLDAAARTSLARGAVMNEHHGIGWKLGRLMPELHGAAWPLGGDQGDDRSARDHEPRQGRLRDGRAHRDGAARTARPPTTAATAGCAGTCARPASSRSARRTRRTATRCRSHPPRAASARGTPRPSTRCTTAPTAAAANRTARRTSRCPRRSSARGPAWSPPAWRRPPRSTCGHASIGGAASTAIPDRGRRRRPAPSASSSAMPCLRARRAASTRRSACWRGPASPRSWSAPVGSTGLVASALGFVDTAKKARRRRARRRRGVRLPPTARPRPRRSLCVRPRLCVAARRGLARGRPRARSDRRAGRGARQRHAAFPAAARQRAVGVPGARSRRPGRRSAVASPAADRRAGSGSWSAGPCAGRSGRTPAARPAGST